MKQPFYREGTGFVYEPPNLPIRLLFDYVEASGIEGKAQLRVESLQISDIVTSFAVNLASERNREGYARTIVKRAQLGDPEFDEVVTALERSFVRCMEAVREPLETYVTDGTARRPPAVRFLLDDLIMAGTINCWLAAPETGKSTFAVGAAVAHQAGVGILGRSILKGSAYFLDWEGDRETFDERYLKVSAGLGIAPPTGIIYERHAAPLRYVLNHVARTCDRHGVTLLIIDAVTTAAGSLTERGGYEAVAVDLEVALRQLPIGLTVLLVDHVDGETVKGRTVPIKGRGSTRKLEFVRNQWSLILDHEAEANRGEHVVGWVHSKKNRIRKLPSFGVRLRHEEEAITFETLEPTMVGSLVRRGTVLERMRAEIEDNGAGMTVRALAVAVLGRDDESAQQQIRNNLKRDDGRTLVRWPGGIVDVKRDAQKPDMRIVNAAEEEPGDLPF